MDKRLVNNQVEVSGEIVSDFVFSHNVREECFYITHVKIQRSGEVFDVLPVMISHRFVNVTKSLIGQWVWVKGQFRSFNLHQENASRLLLFIFAKSFELNQEMEELRSCNQVSLDGYICRTPVYRETPSGKVISDVLFAVNRNFRKADYIPCIFWEKNARYVSGMNVGTHCMLKGKVNSRKYIKKLEDGTMMQKVAYEISVYAIEVLEG